MTRPTVFPVCGFNLPALAVLALNLAMLAATPAVAFGQHTGTNHPANVLNSAALTSGNPLCQAPVLYPKQDFLGGPMAAGDLNGDGKIDIATADRKLTLNSAFSEVGIYLGNGDGTFQAEVTIPMPTYASAIANASAVKIADLNGDGKPDLVTGNASLLGNGDGTFQAPVTFYFGSVDDNLVDVSVADINGDGRPDVVLAGSSLGPLAVFLGNGDGTFQTPVLYGVGDPALKYADSVAVADVNADGHPDLLVAILQDSTFVTGQYAVMLNNGNGTFGNPTFVDLGFFATFISVADVNRDGKADLLVGSRISNTIGILFGNGDGTFQPPSTYSIPPANFITGNTQLSDNLDVALADVNGDGNADLLVTNGLLHFFLGNGDGTFAPAVTYYSQTFSPVAIAVGDVNGDGRPDILTTGNSVGLRVPTANVGVWLNAAGPHIPTATVVTSSSNPVRLTMPVTYIATVTPTSGQSATGTVTFYDGPFAIATVPLSRNQATYTTSYKGFAGGLHNITAAYSGDSQNPASTSRIFTEDVVEYLVASATSITTSRSPSFAGQAVTFTATVSSIYGPITDGEPVTFYDGGAILGVVPLSGGVATLTTTSLTSRTHTIKAHYSSDGSFKPSNATLTQVVNSATTTTTLTSSLNPSNIGQTVTFTATVAASYGAVPDGALVTFYDGSTTIGSGATSGSIATFSTSALTARTHTIRATLAGTPTYKTSSGTLSQIVNRYATTTTLRSGLDPSVYGQSVTWTATVTSTGPNLPTGMVKFVGLGSATLSGDVATLTRQWLNAGDIVITANTWVIPIRRQATPPLWIRV